MIYQGQVVAPYMMRTYVPQQCSFSGPLTLAQGAQSVPFILPRVFTLVFVGVSIAWLPMLDRGQGGQLFNYLQSITSYMAPPIGAVYLMGITTTRANEKVWVQSTYS